MARVSTISKKATKPRKPRLSRSAQMTIDEKYMGPEPFFTEVPSKLEMGKAFTWFNYFYTGKDFKPIVLEWLEEKLGCSAQKIKVIKRAPDYKFNSTIGTIACLEMKGSQILPSSYTWAEKWVAEVEHIAKDLIDPEPVLKPGQKKVEIKKPTIQDRLRDKAFELLAEMDELIEARNIDIYNFMQAKAVNGPIARIIIDRLRPEGEEMIEAAAGTCEQLNEGYSHIPKKELKAIAKFWSDLLSDAERFYDNALATRVRKPRKRKAVSADKLISKMKYQKSDNELKLVSIPPQNIIGAMNVILFNTKYNQLSVLQCYTRDGFTVKGTTIQNIEETKSWSKRVRKPEEAIKKALDGGIRALDNLNQSLKTKSIPVNGRVNENTIILRAF